MSKSNMNKIAVFTAAWSLMYVPFALALIPDQNTDAGILEILIAVDQVEIQQTKVAEQKQIAKEVLDYAQGIDRAHNEHFDTASHLQVALNSSLVDNTSIDNLKEQGKKDTLSLEGTSGFAFEQLFIADLIKSDSNLLDWIDRQSPKDPRLKAFLLQTKAQVSDEFKRAQKIQSHQAIGQT